MKKILLPILILVSFLGSAQTHYNPSQQPGFTFPINKPIGPNGNFNLDARSLKMDTVNFLYRLYNGTSEVLSYLNLPQYRTGYFPCFVNVGGTLQSNGTFVGGTTQVYWFRNGVLDANLVRWYTDSVAGPGGTVTNLTATNSLGYAWTITNPTTTPNISLVLTAGGDLSGTFPNLTVNSIQGHNLAYLQNYANLTNTPPGLSLIVSGTSGPSTYNSGSGVLTIPNYSGSGGTCLNCNADTIGHIPLNFVSFCNHCVLTLDTIAGYAYWAPSTGGTATIPPNIGTGFRIYAPQTPGIKTLICNSGCTIDSTSNTGALTFNVTAGGSGTVTLFSANTITGFATASVSNASTTPALTYNLINAPAYNIWGNNTASPASPFYFAPNISILNQWSGGTIALLGANQTFTGTNTFNGTVTIGAQIVLSANNTYNFGSNTGVAAHVWSRVFTSDAGATLSSTSGSPVNISIGANPGITLLSSGQTQLNNYITSTTFTGTATSVLGVDASGDIIQLPATITIYANQGVSLDTSSTSIKLGGFFYKNDTIDFLHYDFYTPHENNKSILLATDSVEGVAVDGRRFKFPTSAIGGNQTLQQVFTQQANRAVLTVSDTIDAITNTVPLTILGNMRFAGPNGTYSFGDLTHTANQFYTRNISSDGSLALSYASGGGAALNIAKNGVLQSSLLATGQWSWPTYIANAFPGSTASDTVMVENAGAIKTIPISSFGLTANPLSQFAATTSAQLRGIISDETGTGFSVFNNGPQLLSPILNTSSTVGYVWTATNTTGGGTWQAAGGGGGGGGIFLVGPIDSAAGVANGLRINGSSIYAQSASLTVPGMVNLVSQSFKGAKTFDSTYNNNHLVHKTTQTGDSTYVSTKYVVNIGTSITAGAASGYGVPYGTPATFYGYMPFGFAYQLAQDVGMQEYGFPSGANSIYGNLGYPGATLVKLSTGDSSIVDRITTSHDVPYESASIQLVVVEGTTNDANDSALISTSAYYSGVLQVYDTLIARGYTNSQILFVDGPLSGSIRNHRIQVLNAIMATVVDSVGAMFADVYSYEVAHGGFSNVYSDSLHPNNLGHANIERCILGCDSRLARVGRTQSMGELVVTNGFTLGSPWPWPNKYSLQNSSLAGTIVGGDLLIAGNLQAGIEVGFGPTPDTTSTMLAFITQSSKPFVRTGNLKNTLIGYHAGGIGSTENNNTMVGYNAGAVCGSCAANVVVGENSLLADTNGNNNVAIGAGVLLAGQSVGNNVGVGYLALENTTTSGSVGIGYEAGMLITSGANNTVVGNLALSTNTVGSGNTALGSIALQNATGSNNTAEGRQAGGGVTSGSGNTDIGQGAGLNITTGSNNTDIGIQAGYQGADGLASTNTSNSIRIGAFAQVTQNNTAAIGGNLESGMYVRGGLNTPNASSWWQTPVGRSTAGYSPLKLTVGSPFGALTTTALGGTGTTVTFTYAAQSYAPLLPGDKFVVTGAVPSGYNGTYTVTTCTKTAIVASGSTTGGQTTPGTIVALSLLTTPEAGAVEAYNDTIYFTGLSGTRYNLNFPVNIYNSNGSLTGNRTVTMGSNTLTFSGTGTTTFSGFVNFTGGSGGGSSVGVGLLIGNSATPTVVAGTGAGTSPTITISGNDMTGVITIIPGTTPSGSNAKIATITFVGGFVATNGLSVMIQPTDAASALLNGVTQIFAVQDGTNPTTAWDIFSGTTALTTATTYTFQYHVFAY